MIYFSLVALCSFVAMVALLFPKLRTVRAQEDAHNEHVGLGHVLRPLYERASHRATLVWSKIWLRIGPTVKVLFFAVGEKLHQLSVGIAKRLLDFAAVMRGRGVVARKNSSLFQ